MNRLKPSMIFVDAMRRITPEALLALLPSTDPFKTVPIPTGAVASTVPVILQAKEQGFYWVVGGSTSLSSLTRGTFVIPFATIANVPIPVNPGDVFKFSYFVNVLPADNPKVYFITR
jgi:hypothetical protein